MNLFAEQTILTVSRLTTLLKDLLEDNFTQVWVEGEISNLALPASGHAYFTLKDSGAMLRCVMFRGCAKALKFKIEEGMALVVRGRLSVYDQRGEYQLIVEYAEPKGLGALQAAFTQLKDRLAGEGLFSDAHKQSLPFMPQRVGVITSASGAVIHDILNVLG
ncbi:MAG: exodeoxyribonuclease VII large subunit, partial [Trichlorobacter sp.]|uniref:exodeoxyribonuclease VII large subunit n=1 Tax=Trichlorobacter sp. TaxID=2911007 RepID=UPI0025640F02